MPDTKQTPTGTFRKIQSRRKYTGGGPQYKSSLCRVLQNDPYDVSNGCGLPGNRDACARKRNKTDPAFSSHILWLGRGPRKMIMAIPPYVGLSVSILNNNQSYSYCPREESDSSSSESKKQDGDQGMTVLPKKRSFDVAFLISPDDKRPGKSSRADEEGRSVQAERQTYEDENIRSAFKKVGIGFSKLSESRSPSPIDPIRTPSPFEQEKKIVPEMLKPKKEVKPKEEFPFGLGQRPRFQNYQKEMDKSPIFLGSNLMGPVGLGRQNFIPAPIFGPNPILPTSFMTASLLPPSLAALTLPAQNVCAKCNVSFRMTSDLVYHMRSHHKNDHSNSDHQRRRRELDKLKCPVCNESFRERHHLTRHMTAHQDKEGDNIDAEGELRN